MWFYIWFIFCFQENDIVAAGHDNNNISHTTFDDTESENSTPGLTPLNSPCSICKHDGDLGHITPEGESSGFPSPGTTSSQSVPAHHHSTSHLHARPSTITSATRRARPPSSLPLNNSGNHTSVRPSVRPYVRPSIAIDVIIQTFFNAVFFWYGYFLFILNSFLCFYWKFSIILLMLIFGGFLKYHLCFYHRV